MKERLQAITGLLLLGVLFAGAAGCTPPATQDPILPTPTVAPGWERYTASATQGQCGFVIDHPLDMEPASQGTYNWIIRSTAAEPSGPVPNFVYVSVIPDDVPGPDEIIYNYDPAEAQTLLSLQVGESRSLREDPNLADWFRYTRLPDTTLSGLAARTYENLQPWEFPPGTKEIRYYLQANGCTYLIGGYLSTVGSGQMGAIDQELFEQVAATFRLAS